MTTTQSAYTHRKVGQSKIGFKIEPGAFGAAYVAGWMESPTRELAFTDLGQLRAACNGLNTGAWVGDDSRYIPFEIRFERGICPVCYNRYCEHDAANPFILAAKLMTQRNINKAAQVTVEVK